MTTDEIDSIKKKKKRKLKDNKIKKYKRKQKLLVTLILQLSCGSKC